jgi:hypothetical protein
VAIEIREPNPGDLNTASPGWWIKVLSRQLHDRRIGAGWARHRHNMATVRPGLELLDDYYRGEPPMPPGSGAWRDAMREFLRMSRMNYTELVVGSAADRLVPIGWRTAADEDRNGDDRAAALATENNLQLVFGDAIEDMLSQADGYAILGEPRPGSTFPVITAEDPQQVITAHDARTGRAIAGLKMFRDEWDSADLAYLYLAGTPSRVFRAVRRSRSSLLGSKAVVLRFNETAWSWLSDDDETGKPFAKELEGRIPVARLRNRGGVAEHEKHLDVLDRINNGIFDRVSIAKYQAFKQRGLKGLPTHYPEDYEVSELAGKEIDWASMDDLFEADPGALWRLPLGVEVWESQPVDLTPIRSAIKDDVQALAAVTRTPLHYVTPDAAQGSAEGASTMKEAHIFRVEDRRRRADAGICEVMELAFLSMGDKARADRTKLRTIWAPIERHSMQQKASAGTQARSAGLPWSEVMVEIFGYSPAELPRLRRERGQDAFLDPITPTPDPAPPSPGPGAGGQDDA